MATLDARDGTAGRTAPRIGSMLLTAALCAVATLGGCAPMQTFPATEGRPVFDPGLPPLPEMMALAIEAGHERSSIADQPIVFNLPEGARKPVWDAVWRRLPEGSYWANPESTEVVSVEQVRLDGSRGQVDVLVPQGQHWQLFTVHMDGGGLAPWKIRVVQPWTIRTSPPAINVPYTPVAGN